MGSEADILGCPYSDYSSFPLTLAQPTPRILQSATPHPSSSVYQHHWPAQFRGKLYSLYAEANKSRSRLIQNARPFPHITSFLYPHHSSPRSSLYNSLYQSPSVKLCSYRTAFVLQCTPSSDLILSSRSSSRANLPTVSLHRCLLRISHLEPPEPSPPIYNGGPVQRIIPCEKREDNKGNILVGTQLSAPR